MSLPSLIESPYLLGGVNARLRAFKGALTLSEGPSAAAGPGALTATWLPSPRLEFTTSAIGVLGMGPDPVSVSIRGASSPASGRVTHVRMSSGGSTKSETTGFVTGRLTRGGGGHLYRVLFHVANFPFYAGDPASGRRSVVRSRAVVADDTWEIRLDGREDSKGLLAGLRRSGGYAVSHVGELVRADGSEFSAAAAQDVLECLGELLSFASGARTYPFLAIGYDLRGRSVWRSWEVPAVTQWAGRFCWLDASDGGCLDRAFKGLSTRWADAHQREVARRAIYMLTESNRRGIEPSLITAQAALELLAWQVLVTEKKTLSRVGFDALPAADMLRLLLTTSGVPLDIPAELADLSAFSKQRSGLDGPESLTALRNSWVHPPRKGFTRAGREHGDAWLLALWYVDLVLLRWLGYEGDYAARVRGGSVEPVPWT